MARQTKTMDGNSAAAHVSYAFTDLAAIYPITPSSVMAELTDKWSAENKHNLFKQPVKVVEMQSEAGAAGTVHGSLAAGALTTTYTASQGLLLMIPNMYKMAGELLPSVIHCSARTIASHALSIFGDHSDIYAVRQTGYAMLCAGNVQEIMDLGAVAHLSAIRGSVPFLHFFDGFRTSHEIQKISVWDYNDLDSMLDKEAVEKYRKNCLNPDRPVLRGSAQNPDIFFQAREASNVYYNAIPNIVQDYMDQVNKKIGSDYALFNYYGDPNATDIIIAMGSVCDTIEEVIDYKNANGDAVGLVKVRLYRPFSREHLLSALPKSTKTITVLDRTKEAGAIGEPLYLDVLAGIKDSAFANISVFGGRYGLSSKDVPPASIFAVYQNAAQNGKRRFTVGICDDVTNLSLEQQPAPDTTPNGTVSCKFWGLGADGTVGANKNSIKIIGDHTDLYAQGYFAYDSKKSGGVTTSHLRFGSSKIKSTYFVNKADFVACHNASYLGRYDMVSDIKPNGIFLLNCSYTASDIEQHLPNFTKRIIAQNNIKLYTIDAVAIARELGLGGRINTILQSAFFALADILPLPDAISYMKQAATASYSKKGEAIVKMNHDAIDIGASRIQQIEVPASWANLQGELTTPRATGDSKLVNFVNDILHPVTAQQGDSLPVSAFKSYADGHLPQGTAAFEKRGIAVDVPCWESENCIQCNFCSFVCPHAVIRPTAYSEADLTSAPSSTKTIAMTAMPDLKFGINISPLDCTGCGACVAVCPGKKGQKALVMKPLESQAAQQEVFAFAKTLPPKAEVATKFKPTTVKGSQFNTPLLEFSGACAGCGETPYAKLVTQLFGDRMYIANATGCSSIWGGSSPSTPYTVNHQGKGPAWANSLFEDNAEFGYGIYLAQATLRQSLATKLLAMQPTAVPAVQSAIQAYLESYNVGCENAIATTELISALNQAEQTAEVCEILNDREFLAKKSNWIFGGDGWAYDIGFGGLDHVIASGEDVNILVFDTEIYSNTGGQASKSTPTGAVAQFAAAGKSVKKKDLAAIAMTYGYVYVAQVAMGADYNQCIKAITEAESYNGPSIIIAYSPCISHGIAGGLVNAQATSKLAVQSGYWHNFRFDPRLADQGENPFKLDSAKPTLSYEDFINNELRYTSLAKAYPDRARELFAAASTNADKKYQHLLRLQQLYER